MVEVRSFLYHLGDAGENVPEGKFLSQLQPDLPGAAAYGRAVLCINSCWRRNCSEVAVCLTGCHRGQQEA